MINGEVVSTMTAEQIIAHDRLLRKELRWEDQSRFHETIGVTSKNPHYEARLRNLGIDRIYDPANDMFALCKREDGFAYRRAMQACIDSVGGSVKDLKFAQADLKKQWRDTCPAVFGR